MASPSRVARIFISSTFRDFSEERDLLVNKVFPALRSQLKERYVELVDVDLRWGITVEQAERGEVLPICLAEIDRARPFFVGMLGARYGWVPDDDIFVQDLVEKHPWLAEHRGGKSVTELEIMHGVLNNPEMAGRAFFYFRAAEYADAKGVDYQPVSEEASAKQAVLKDQIRSSGFPFVEDYPSPEAFANQLQSDLWEALDARYPADEVPDIFERKSNLHEAYAAPRRRLFVGGAGYIDALDKAIEAAEPRVLIEGQSGGGKSALLANWAAGWRLRHPGDYLLEHYTAATGDASKPDILVRRLIEWIKRTTGSEDEIATDSDALFDSLPQWFALASAYAVKNGGRWVFVLDALNGLQELRDLRWFPGFLPEHVHMVVSTLPGTVLDALQDKGPWKHIEVTPLSSEARPELLRRFLQNYNKTLPEELEDKVLGHDLASVPLFLKTLAEELRLFGVHEELSERLDHYLESKTVDDLFERVLERVEGHCGEATVKSAMTAIWASRSGLTETELFGLTALVPATWAEIYHALEEELLDSGGQITFAHDFMRIAVSDRYLEGNNTMADEGQSDAALELRREAHVRVAEWFESQPVDARAVEEVPYQWQMAQEWTRLQASLTDMKMFVAFDEYSSDEALLSYWLVLEKHTEADMEANYQAAWKRWDLDRETETTAHTAALIGDLLYFSGRYGDFTEALFRQHLEIREKVLGPEHYDTATSLNCLGLLLQAKGDYEGAEALFRQHLEIREKVLGPEHPDTAISLNNLGLLLQDKGDYEGAEPLHRRSLAINQKVLRPEHPGTATSLNNLGLLLHAKGDYDAAEPFYRRSLEIQEKVLGPEHPDKATSLNNLGGLLYNKGDYDAAEPLYRRSLEIREKVLGPEHPETAKNLSNLGGLQRDKGDYDAAEPLYRRCLEILEKVFGPEHPDTAAALNNLGGLLKAKGDYDAAEPLYRRSLEIREKVLGPEHPETAAALSNLGFLLDEKGDYDAAEPLYRRSLEIKEKVLGPEHPDTALGLNNLGVLLYEKGDYDRAEPLYRRSLEIREKVLGPEHPDTALSLSILGVLLNRKGDYDAAEPLYRRSLEIREKVFGPEHPDTAAALSNLGFLLDEKGDYDAAEPLYRRSLEIREKVLGPEHPDTAIDLNNLGLLLKNKGDYDAAEPLYRRSLEIQEKVLGPEHPDTATSLNNLGLLLSDKGDYNGAEPLYRRSLEISEKVFGPEHPNTATILSSLGFLLENKGDYDAAEPLYRRGLEIREKVLGPEHPNTAISLNNLGALLSDKGDYDAAEPLYRRGLEIQEKVLGPEHPDNAAALNNLGLLLYDKGDYDAAEPLYRRSLEISEKVLGPEHPDTVVSRRGYRKVLMKLGRSEDARTMMGETGMFDVIALQEIFENAAIKNTLDDDGDIYLTDGVEFPLWVTLDHEAETLSLRTFRNMGDVPLKEAVIFANSANKDVIMPSFYVMSDDDGKLKLWANFYFFYSDAPIPKSIIYAVRRFSGAFRYALSRDEDDYFFPA